MPDYTIGTLKKGLYILAKLCERHEKAFGQSIRLRDLAHYTNIPASQLIRYLETLEEMGFAARADDRWLPGPKLVALGYQVITTWLAYEGGRDSHGSSESADQEG